MRILVLSDSHGCVDPMQQCVELVQPQAILHLGDCARDADRSRWWGCPATVTMAARTSRSG